MFDWVLNGTLEPLIITPYYMLMLPPHNTKFPFSARDVDNFQTSVNS